MDSSKVCKVLLIAEAANPEWTSVPLVGWSLAKAIRKCTNAHIATHIRNKDAFVRAGLVEGKDFTAIDNEYIASPLHKLGQVLRGGTGVGWTTAMAVSSFAYYAFEYEVWRQFGSRIQRGEYDLVHRITPLSPTLQSLIAKRITKTGVPFVIGPLNGGVPWPKGFISRQHAEKEWLSHVRNAYKLMPYYRATREYSSAIISGSRHTLSEMPEWAKAKSIYLPENGVDMNRFDEPRDRTASVPLSAAFIGRLVPYKGTDMLIEAAAKYLKDQKLTLEIIGDGPERKRLEAVTEELELSECVTFHGWVPHTEVQHILRNCDFLALPSVREFGGGVVLEAMALGVTPIVADYAGPSELVDDETGFRVPFCDKVSLVAGFERIIGQIMQSPEILDKIGAAARRKVLSEFTWEAKAKKIINIYRDVLANTGKRTNC